MRFTKSIEFKELNITTEVPKSLMSHPLFVRMYWSQNDLTSPFDSKYMTVGGIFYLDFYEFLPLPKRTNSIFVY